LGISYFYATYIMEKGLADVSIVVANYNNGKYISKFISSVISSTFLPKELILVDDGSQDDSIAQIISFLNDNNFIQLIRFPQNKGFAHALNEGVRLASGKYIMRVDPDDYLHPERIERQYKFLESNQQVDVLGSNIFYFDSASGKVVFYSNVPLDHAQIVKTFQSGNCGIIHGSMMCKSTLMKQFKYDQKSVPAEDYELFSLMLKVGYKSGNLPDALTYVRIHINSISNDLPFDTIRKTFELKHRIWNTKTDLLTVKRTHLYLYYYRKFLFTKGGQKYIYLFLAVLFNPMKLFARLTASR
jgi:glycosyltransferase involved in cell wall biosynthesis